MAPLHDAHHFRLAQGEPSESGAVPPSLSPTSDHPSHSCSAHHQNAFSSADPPTQERSMTREILRKLSPKEADLVADPVVNARIYTKGTNVHYFSGSRIIEPGSKAAIDACTVMGARLFTENLIRHESQHGVLRVADPIDVTNRLDINAPSTTGRLSTQPPRRADHDRPSLARSRGPPRSIPMAPKEPSPSVALNPMQQAQQVVGLEDEFGRLFEWTTDLSVAHLEDYVVG
ncbi:hypothetical protein BDK51DRAFT_51765 [Blyttiomyces helicus]|uniref:Uncharacterized protein n=1 Tax=Blyttiomyces helicus TaxID=388810 RepID=A0A4P9W0Q9_9FUNG|nr:hypothetical protein BDK51DRAFT_51765 [Blyttiomyces helicus]|eukprot:RKO85741.1 hypothetical protein BDK51DRAFT_51765 [Blyttiomyces helicus]